MAPKKVRLSPLEDPPTASSSSDDEDEKKTSSQQPEDEEDGSSSDEGEEEASSDDEEDQPKPPSQPVSKIPPSKQPPTSESGSSSESGSESDPEPTTPLNPKVKPLVQPQTQTQVQAHPATVHARSGAKRPIENINSNNGDDTKRSKKKTTTIATGDDEMKAAGKISGEDNGDDTKRSKKKTITTATSDDEMKEAGKISGEDNDTKRSKKKTTTATTATSDDEMKEAGKISGEDSKKMSQNQIREENELTILKGLADFISKKGKDPLKDTVAFHSFVKNLLHGDPTREQLMRKVRRLKAKFENSDHFTKPHDKKAFELFKKFKKVWGSESNGKPNEKIVKSPTKSTKKEATNRNIGSPKKEVATKKESEKVESVVDDSNLALTEMYRFDKGVGLSGLNKDLVKKGLELMGKSKRVEIEERWEEWQIAELEVFKQRAQLSKDQISLVLEALRKN